MLRAWFRCVHCSHVWRGSVVASLTYFGPQHDHVETPAPPDESDSGFDPAELELPAPEPLPDDNIAHAMAGVDNRLLESTTRTATRTSLAELPDRAPALPRPDTDPVTSLDDLEPPPRGDAAERTGIDPRELDEVLAAPSRPEPGLDRVQVAPPPRLDNPFPSQKQLVERGLVQLKELERGLDRIVQQLGKDSEFDTVVHPWQPMTTADGTTKDSDSETDGDDPPPSRPSR